MRVCTTARSQLSGYADRPAKRHADVEIRIKPRYVASLFGSVAMNELGDPHQIPSDVRAAIGAFLNECQKDPQPFAVSKALDAVRRVFPDLEVSDADLGARPDSSGWRLLHER